jgi:hypothetical protein
MGENERNQSSGEIMTKKKATRTVKPAAKKGSVGASTVRTAVASARATQSLSVTKKKKAAAQASASNE